MNNSSVEEFIVNISSSAPIVYVQTQEVERTVDEYANLIKTKFLNNAKKEIYCWDMVSGLFNPLLPNHEGNEGAEDLFYPLNYMGEQIKKDRSTVIFLKDYNYFCFGENSNLFIIRTMANMVEAMKNVGCTFVIVSPEVHVHPIIEKYTSVLKFELPSQKEIIETINNFCKNNDLSDVAPDNIETIANYATGLTLFEVESAVAFSLALTGKIDEHTIYSRKEQMIRNNSALSVYKSDEGFESIAGLDNLKKFVSKQVGKKGAKGVLLLGVPGGGKSKFARTVGKETGRLTIQMDIGRMMGSLVGETEKNTSQALNVIDAMSPCVLFVDEIEKGLAGVSGHNGDSGTSQRQGGKILQWLSDHDSDVYVIATANDISKLPPEYLRAGRWDAIFFVDLPEEEERKAIFEIYKNKYNLQEEFPSFTSNWTGAEIEKLCQLSDSLECSLEEAHEYICPIYNTMKEKIDSLRAFSKGRTVMANIAVNNTVTTKQTTKNRKIEQIN